MSTGYSRVLITGASGMVGSALRSVVPSAIAPTREEMDLLGQIDIGSPEAVIHLAARVGGVKANSDYVAEFFIENIKMNTNLLHECMKSDVKKVVSLLSTCVYPDKVTYPITEDQLHSGEPHSSNFGYAYSKRMLEVQSRAYRQQYGCNFICAIPNNLYGENDNYDLDDGHVIPALVRKIWEAKLSNNSSVEVWGDGTPVREFTYSKDIAEILLFLLDNYDDKEPINIGNTEEHSIADVVKLICKQLDYNGEIVWNTDMPSGQHRKPSDNTKLIDLGWDKNKYTPLKEGLKNTCDWFIMNYPNVRGVK